MTLVELEALPLLPALSIIRSALSRSMFFTVSLQALLVTTFVISKTYSSNSLSVTRRSFENFTISFHPASTIPFIAFEFPREGCMSLDPIEKPRMRRNSLVIHWISYIRSNARAWPKSWTISWMILELITPNDFLHR